MAKGTNRTVSVNPMFKLLLWINGAWCAVTLGIMVWIAAAVADGRCRRRGNDCKMYANMYSR